MQRFVERCDSFFPDSVINQGIAAQRQAYNTMTASFAKEQATSLIISDQLLNGVNTRRYQPKGDVNTTVFYAHGGGWYLGSLNSHDSFCAAIAKHCQVCVISIDYRLSPEHPFPAGLNDCYAVYQALIQQGIRPLLLGDSAGANLMAALTLRARDNQLTCALAQILIYPALAPPLSLSSHQQFCDAPLLSAQSMAFCLQNYIPHCYQTSNNPAIFPLQATSLAALPQAVILAAQFDPLVDDARLYSQSLQEQGVSAQYIEIKGLVHGALHAIGSCDEANVLFAAICDQVQGFKEYSG